MKALRNILGASAILVLCGQPVAWAEQPPLAGTAYVTSWFGSVVAVVDLAQGKVKQTIPIPAATALVSPASGVGC